MGIGSFFYKKWIFITNKDFHFSQKKIEYLAVLIGKNETESIIQRRKIEWL